MTLSVRSLLDTFDALSETDRVEAAVEILRRVTPAESELPEQVFAEAADTLFSLLDAEEEGAVTWAAVRRAVPELRKGLHSPSGRPSRRAILPFSSRMKVISRLCFSNSARYRKRVDLSIGPRSRSRNVLSSPREPSWFLPSFLIAHSECFSGSLGEEFGIDFASLSCDEHFLESFGGLRVGIGDGFKRFVGQCRHDSTRDALRECACVALIRVGQNDDREFVVDEPGKLRGEAGDAATMREPAVAVDRADLPAESVLCGLALGERGRRPHAFQGRFLEQSLGIERGVPLDQVADGRDEHPRGEWLGGADVLSVPQLLAVPGVALRRLGMTVCKSFTRVCVISSGLKIRSARKSPKLFPVTFSMSSPSRK